MSRCPGWLCLHGGAALLGLICGQLWLQFDGPNTVAGMTARRAAHVNRHAPHRASGDGAEVPGATLATPAHAVEESRPQPTGSADPTASPSGRARESASPSIPLSATWAGHRHDPAPPPVLLRSAVWTSPVVQSDTAADAAEAPPGRDPGTLARRAMEDAARVHEAVGRRPWMDSEFQCFGVLARQFGFCTPGSDFTVYASPEASLVWHESTHGHSLPEALRAQALDLLRRYEVDRRKLSNDIWAYLQEQAPKSIATEDVVAFKVENDRLTLVRRGEQSELDSLPRDLELLETQFWADIRRLARGELR